MKAKNVRWRIQKGDWLVLHVPGAGMPADMGAKALAAQRLEELKTITGMVDLQKELGRKEEQRDEEKVIAKKGREELEAVLRMIVVATTISMSKAEEEVEEIEEGKIPWEMMVVFAFAAWGIISIIGMIVKMMSHYVRKEKEDEEEAEEKTEEEEEREEPRRPTFLEEETRKEAPKQQLTQRGSTSRRTHDRVPSSAASSADPQGTREERREVIKEDRDKGAGHSMMTEPRQPAPQPQKPSFQVLTTDWGTRYHIDMKCPSLANSRRLVFSPWCPHCAVHDVPKGTKLKIQGPGLTAHTQKWCGEGRVYQACSHCVPNETA